MIVFLLSEPFAIIGPYGISVTLKIRIPQLESISMLAAAEAGVKIHHLQLTRDDHEEAPRDLSTWTITYKDPNT